MHSHFPSPPLCVLVRTRRRSAMLNVGWAALPSPPSCSCLNHQSHGRLNDGLCCYGVCELCTRQLCLLATSNSLHPKMNHISVLMRSAAVLALCIPLRNSLAARPARRFTLSSPRLLPAFRHSSSPSPLSMPCPFLPPSQSSSRRLPSSLPLFPPSLSLSVLLLQPEYLINCISKHQLRVFSRVTSENVWHATLLLSAAVADLLTSLESKENYALVSNFRIAVV